MTHKILFTLCLTCGRRLASPKALALCEECADAAHQPYAGKLAPDNQQPRYKLTPAGAAALTKGG